MADPRDERILVTGGTGFIGRYVVESLLQDGFRPLVTAWHMRASHADAAVDFVELDLTDGAATRALVESYRPHLVVNLAGATGHDDPTGELCRTVNVDGTRNLLNALNDVGVARVILLGSASEYGRQPTPFREDMPAMPESHYGRSKAEITSIALEMHAASGIPVVVLRVFSAFGYGQPAKMFLPQLINHGLLNRRFDMSDGSQKRDYVYAGDVAVAVRAAMAAKSAVGRIINIASGRGTALRELAMKAWDLCGADDDHLKIGSLGKTGDDGVDTEADISLAEQLLRWRPENSILPQEGKHFALPELIRRMKKDSARAR